MCGELTGRERFLKFPAEEIRCAVRRRMGHCQASSRLNSEGINDGEREEKIPGIPGIGCRR